MKTVLIIGAAGFVGQYLIKNLKSHGYKVIPTKLRIQNNCSNKFVNLDILKKEEIVMILKKFKPDYIVNLAAQASVALSWKKPIQTFQVNVIGTLNLLDTIKDLNFKTRILLIGTSEQYGKQSVLPIKETSKCNPNNFYALSKLTQEKIALIYHKVYGLDIILTRSFNHIGPGQSTGYVIPDFKAQIINIKNNIQKPMINVGNLSIKRDFSDVRDIVDDYRLLLERGKSGEIYNVGSGKAYSIEYLLNVMINNENIKIKIDKNKYRPNDIPIMLADISKLTKDVSPNHKHNILKTILEI